MGKNVNAVNMPVENYDTMGFVNRGIPPSFVIL